MGVNGKKHKDDRMDQPTIKGDKYGWVREGLILEMDAE